MKWRSFLHWQFLVAYCLLDFHKSFRLQNHLGQVMLMMVPTFIPQLCDFYQYFFIYVFFFSWHQIIKVNQLILKMFRKIWAAKAHNLQKKKKRKKEITNLLLPQTLNLWQYFLLIYQRCFLCWLVQCFRKNKELITHFN